MCKSQNFVFIHLTYFINCSHVLLSLSSVGKWQKKVWSLFCTQICLNNTDMFKQAYVEKHTSFNMLQYTAAYWETGLGPGNSILKRCCVTSRDLKIKYYDADVGHNKVQILQYCVEVNFLGSCALLVFIFLTIFHFSSLHLNTNIWTLYSFHFFKQARYFSLNPFVFLAVPRTCYQSKILGMRLTNLQIFWCV